MGGYLIKKWSMSTSLVTIAISRIGILMLIVFPFSLCYAQLYSYHGKNSYGVGAKLRIGFHITCVRESKVFLEGSVNAGYLYNGSNVGVTPQAQYSVKYNTFSTTEKEWSHQLFGSLQFPIALYHGQKNNRISTNPHYYQPFYAFADLSSPAIQNPYHAALSPGIQWIRLYDQEKRRKDQRVFSINVKIGEGHFFYHNDMKMWRITDGKDRWYTSSALFAWHRNIHERINHYAIAYNRFTGYQPFSYEVSKRMGLNYVDYKDQNQIRYNEDYYKITVGHHGVGEANIRFINFNYKTMQGQTFIHYIGNMPYHLDNSKQRIALDIEPSLFLLKHYHNAHN